MTKLRLVKCDTSRLKLHDSLSAENNATRKTLIWKCHSYVTSPESLSPPTSVNAITIHTAPAFIRLLSAEMTAAFHCSVLQSRCNCARQIKSSPLSACCRAGGWSSVRCPGHSGGRGPRPAWWRVPDAMCGTHNTTPVNIREKCGVNNAASYSSIMIWTSWKSSLLLFPINTNTFCMKLFFFTIICSRLWQPWCGRGLVAQDPGHKDSFKSAKTTRAMRYLWRVTLTRAGPRCEHSLWRKGMKWKFRTN